MNASDERREMERKAEGYAISNYDKAKHEMLAGHTRLCDLAERLAVDAGRCMSRISDLEREKEDLAEALRGVLRAWSSALADGPMDMCDVENIMHGSCERARLALTRARDEARERLAAIMERAQRPTAQEASKP